MTEDYIIDPIDPPGRVDRVSNLGSRGYIGDKIRELARQYPVEILTATVPVPVELDWAPE